MLHRTVNRKLLFVLVKELVVTQSAAINNMLSLLGNIGFVRLIVELITSATKLVGCVIFQVNAAVSRRTVISTQPERIHVKLTQFRKSVTIGIIRITVAVSLIQCNAVRVITRHQ